MEARGPSAYIAEFVGTLLLVLSIALIVSVYAGSGVSTPEFAVIGLLHAFVLMMLISTRAGVSGAHFNPAMTLGLAAPRQIRPGAAGVYVGLQCLRPIRCAAPATPTPAGLAGRPKQRY